MSRSKPLRAHTECLLGERRLLEAPSGSLSDQVTVATESVVAVSPRARK